MPVMRNKSPQATDQIGRRRLLKLISYAAAAPLFSLSPARSAGSAIITRPIPRTGEQLPVIGMGSFLTFDVAGDTIRLRQRTEVLRAFFAAGGKLIDSSPMYDSSEAALGDCLARLGHPEALFSATKVWHPLTSQGDLQMQDSRRLWQLPRFDLMQVHNLLNWRDHLATVRRDRDAGLVRYIGVTTSHGSRHDELANVLRTEDIDFIQVTYNLLDRKVEDRLLPLAADRGVGVIINRPFRRGGLIDQLEGQPLPPWAGEIECDSWATFLLKFIVSHPAVTCAIPATTRTDHMRENMSVLRGPLPDARMRSEMIRYVASL
jgi:diketogulonate reductase-like aldo/keto reductase